MTFYELDGAYGTPVSYSVYGQKQFISWRLLLVLAVLILFVGSGYAVSKTYSSLESVSASGPAITQPVPQKPIPFVLGAATGNETSTNLKNELEVWMSNQDGSEWAFNIQSLDDDSLQVGLNENKQFQMASIYKLFLLKPLASKIPAEAWASSFVSERTYLDCVTAMLAVSDNPCAESIASRVGWNKLHSQVQLDGYRQTVLNDTDKFGSTVADTGLLLDRLFHGDGYDAKTKEIALNALGKRKGSEAIRKSCVGCTVFNKTGDLGGFKHDAAIVSKNGKNYVVVIFSKDANWAQLVDAGNIISNRL